MFLNKRINQTHVTHNIIAATVSHMVGTFHERNTLVKMTTRQKSTAVNFLFQLKKYTKKFQPTITTHVFCAH